MKKNCAKCPTGGPEGESHYYILVKNGEIIGVWYASGSGYWDRELEADDWFVEEVE